MSNKINIIFKLILLKFYFSIIINNRKNNVKNKIINVSYNYLFLYNLSKQSLVTTSQILSLQNYYSDNNYNLKKLNFFKCSKINLLLFYNLSSINLKKYVNNFNNSISNYDAYNIFFFYSNFIKNININSNKYHTNFYQNNLYFIRFFIFKYLSMFVTDKNVFLSLQKNNITVFEKNMLYKILLKKTKRLGFLKEISFKIKSFINLVLTCFFSKDIILFKNIIKGILEKLHFKKHKKFLYNLRVLLKSISYIFFYRFKCLGLYVRIKGKIGVGGSSKTRKFIFKLGSFSFTKKAQKLVYTNDAIRTYSGVLGFESYLTYL